MSKQLDAHMARLFNASCRVNALTDVKTPSAQDEIKRLQALLWKLLRPCNKQAFMSALDENLNLIGPIKQIPSEDLEILTMIRGWQEVIANVTPDDRSFALSIMKKRGNQDWWPSKAQIHKMKTLWNERSIEGGEVEVTE